MLSGTTVAAIAPGIVAARDVEERMQKLSKEMGPRWISWNVVALHAFEFPKYGVGRRLRLYRRENAKFLPAIGMKRQLPT